MLSRGRCDDTMSMHEKGTADLPSRWIEPDSVLREGHKRSRMVCKGTVGEAS